MELYLVKEGKFMLFGFPPDTKQEQADQLLKPMLDQGWRIAEAEAVEKHAAAVEKAAEERAKRGVAEQKEEDARRQAAVKAYPELAGLI